MSNAAETAKRNELINFLPILTLASAIFASEGLGLDIPSRIIMGIHIIAFYWISIRMVFKKNFSKLVILLIIFPGTAVPTYIVMLFFRPRSAEVSPAQAKGEWSHSTNTAEPTDLGDKQ